MFSIFVFVLMKLEEELIRAKYILSEGDAAAFLPIKSHGVVIIYF